MSDPVLVKISRTKPRHPVAAYEFICDAVTMTAQQYKLEHLTPDQVTLGAVLEAAEEFGLMAPTVFRYWRIKNTTDLADMVLRLIDAEVLTGEDGDVLGAFKLDLGQTFVDVLEEYMKHLGVVA